MRLPAVDVETLFEPGDWKKRLITLAAQDTELCEPPIVDSTTPQTNEPIMTSTNGTRNHKHITNVKDASDSEFVQTNTIKLTEKFQKSPASTTPDMTLAPIRIKRIRISSNRRRNQTKRSTKSVTNTSQDDLLHNDDKLSDDRLTRKSPSVISSKSELSNQTSLDDSDSDDPIWLQNKRSRNHQLFSISNKKKKVPFYLSSTDSESSLTNNDKDIYNRYHNVDPSFLKLMNKINKISKSKGRLKNKSKQVKKLYGVKSKRRKLNGLSCTRSTPNTQASSAPKKYVQFCVTHVYSPVPYSEALKNIIDENGVNETMEVLDDSVIEYMSSSAPLLHSTANITVFNSDQMPKKESFNAGVNYDLFKLREKFQEFKHQVVTLLEENTNIVKKYCELQVLKPNKTSGIQETIKSILPSRSLDDFLKFNELLAESVPHREELKKMYQVIICGETSIKSCIRKIMKFTLSNVVESEYSGVGKKFRGVTKLNYSKTQTFQCLQDVLIEKFGLIPELKNLGGRVGQWLSSNGDREGIHKMKTEEKLTDSSI